MRRAILNTTAVALAGRAGGFLVPFVIAYAFGSTRETDAFFLVYGGILALMLVLGHLFESVIVPHITDNTSGASGVSRLVGATLTRTTVFLGLLLLVGLFVLKPTLAAATQLTQASLTLAFGLFLIMSPMVLLTAWTSVFIGALNAKRVFHVGALSPLYRSTMVILALLLLHESLGIYSVAVGYLLGEGLRLLVASYCYTKHCRPPELSWTANAATSEFFTSAAYQTVGFGILCLTPIVNNVAAAWMPPGDLSVLAYALQLRNVPSLIFATGLGTVVLSHWADAHARASGEFTWARVERVLAKLFVVAAVCALALVLGREWIVSVVLQWGAFPQDKMPLVATLFALFVVSLPFDVSALLCVRVLMILKRDATYMFLAVVKLLALVILNLTLIPVLGLLGIAVATTAATTLHAVAIFYFVAQQRSLLRGPHSAVAQDGGNLHAEGAFMSRAMR